MLLSGIFPPITTPFYPDGEVYYKKIESNVERYSRTPVAGIVVQGSTGEAILLSDQERRDVLKTALAAAAPNKVMIAGTGIESPVKLCASPNTPPNWAMTPPWCELHTITKSRCTRRTCWLSIAP